MDSDDTSVGDRLSLLEKKCEEQEAHIDGLVSALSDLLAAHVVLHKDLRPCTYLAASVQADREAEQGGGNKYTSASWFAARCEIFAKILAATHSSSVFDDYWFRSLFASREERQQKHLAKTRGAIIDKLYPSGRMP